MFLTNSWTHFEKTTPRPPNAPVLLRRIQVNLPVDPLALTAFARRKNRLIYLAPPALIFEFSPRRRTLRNNAIDLPDGRVLR